MIKRVPSSSGVGSTCADLPPASPARPKNQHISCLPSPGTKIKDRLRYFEADQEKQKSSFDSTLSSSERKASLSDAPKLKAQASMAPQRRVSLFTSPRTVIPVPPLMESNGSTGTSKFNFENKKGFHRRSSGDSYSCSTTSVESLSDSSMNPAEIYGFEDTKSSAQDYEDVNHRSTTSSKPSRMYDQEVAAKNSRNQHASASLLPKKRSENNASGSSISDASTRDAKTSVTCLPPPPFGATSAPSKLPFASSKSSATWTAPSAPKKPTPTSTHAFTTSSPSFVLSPVKSRIKMLNVEKASQASNNNVTRFPIVPSTTKNPIYDSPTRSPGTSKVFMHSSPSCTPPEKSVCEIPLSIPGTPVKAVCEIPLQSAMKSPIRTAFKFARSITFSDELAQDLETKEVIKKEPSQEVIKKEPSKVECIEAATKIQAVARGRQGRIKSRTLMRYFSLRKQLDEAEGKEQQDLRMIREELDKKKKDLFERAQARSSMRHNDKSEKVEEKQALIQSLRDANSKMRTQISKMKSECKDLREENFQFENSLAVREDYFAKLNTHQEGALEEHESLLKVTAIYKAKVDELEEVIEIINQYAGAEINMKMAYRKCMLTTAEMLESSDDEYLKDLVSSSVIACMDYEEKMKSTPTVIDAHSELGFDLDAKRARRALETVVEEEEEAPTQNAPKNDNDPGNDSPAIARSPPSPKSPSPRSPRKSSASPSRSPKKKCPRTPVSPRKVCIM